jgi:hypothetical protein
MIKRQMCLPPRIADPSAIPIRTFASRLDKPLESPCRDALCAAATAVGDGGRGAGFMDCAMLRGMVGMLHDEMTGPMMPDKQRIMDT